ncbi:MAG: class I SAM-dependent methyltransferase [Fibrobacteria bacterium]
MDLREVREGLAQRHPWERARARLFGELLAARRTLPAPCRILDIGAGDGFFASRLLPRLAPDSAIVCFDPNYSPSALSQLRSVASPGISYTAEPPRGAFDLLLLLDVIEHVPDDAATLTGWVKGALKPGGRALVSVPAFMSLFTAHDVALGHHRRYRLSELPSLFSRSGLNLEARGGAFHSLILPRLLAKLGEKLKGIHSRPLPEQAAAQAETDAGAWNGSRWLTQGVDLALRMDNGLTLALAASGTVLPGLSAWALGRKP